MSLYGVLNIGVSALQAQQAALQVTGNNLANAADPNYTREVANLSPNVDSPSPSGLLVGGGVSVTSIQRQVDLALNQRLTSAGSDQSAATTLQNWSGQVQSVFNALSGNGISDQLNTFFNDWSTLANNPSSSGQRGVVVQDGQNLAQTFNSTAANLSSINSSIQQAAGQSIQQINQFAQQIASLNQQIVQATNGGQQQPNGLLDQRDADVTQLSNITNIQTVNTANNGMDVYIGNEALVNGTSNQTLNATTVQNNGHSDISVQFSGDGSTAPVTGGSLGGLIQSQQLVDSTTDSLNSLASNLISSLNTLHSGGQGLQGYTSLTGATAVTDPTQPLASAAAGLPTNTPVPKTGSFVISLTNTTTGLSTSTLVPITETGSTTDTTLNSLAASLSAISGVQATVKNGQLSIQSTNPNTQISFSQDSSGVLSSLGLNTFFSGSDASSISVNSQLAGNPSLLAAASNGSPDDNTNALAIAGLNDAPQAGLNGNSLSQAYGTLISNVGGAAANANNNLTATTSVQSTLTAQQQSLSGVSTDQEALNMIVEQRAYQGAARLISVVDSMMQSLLAIT
jgi:flagellar hook-associated protein 1 FlgK